MALPLKITGKTIGALDVQSTEPSAFTNEDIASLSVLADQVSIAIENARLYESTRKSLEQTESAYRRYVQNEWTRLAREEKLTGFQYANGNSVALEAPLDLGQIAETIRDGNIHQSEAGPDGKPAELGVPVKLRGEVIGILHITTSQKPRWTDDDIDIAEAVAERLAISMENARLFQSSANRAARERIVSDISSRISGNIHVKNILQTAAQELSQALNGSDVLIQLQTPKQPAEVEE
jgi:GAF domain-containing protein